MGIVKGGFLRLFQTFLYFLAFCCSAIGLGIYSYFLATLTDRDRPIEQWKRAVEGLSGVATLYTICAVCLTCCLGGISFLAFIAIVLDICFVGCMIAIAVLTRDGASSCTGNVQTPLGDGAADSSTGGFGQGGFGTSSGEGENVTYSVSLGTACQLNTAVFAVSIIGAFLFLCTAAMQIALVRHHKKEKRYGPSPSNNYTSGFGKRNFFSRKKKTDPEAGKDSELGTYGAGVPPSTLAAGGNQDLRPSHETGSTAVAPDNGYYDKVDHVGHGNHMPHGAHGGYYTQPQGTGVNPYGYDQPTYTTGTATNY
ncbi:hypothetical protein KC340_g194 [Hortaea werneckii]|nr:hypothetical protein KC339_g546 [Hortaea werneckii]KAI7245261.1 hypothetical protein KC365_g607 [Hortaea werneckii]KAI7340678.1 hypothetical protein KC340_g194 [Hortaea werneckii]KAI7387958.1 hypothetical protein KC328_g9193 [Hortaea werneckii]